MAKIFFARGPLRRQEFVLKPEGFTLGRSPGNDVVLPDDSVSRRHARFARDADGWFVEDAGSLNGVRVNGEAVRKRPLMDRDVVVVGRSDIAFLAEDDSEFSFEDRTSDLRSALRGRYHVEGTLGSGAQADVYQAKSSAGRACAIKVLTQPADAGTGDVRRFQREARALMALKHPHIVEILEVDEAGGFNFMALEFLEGGSLEDRLLKHGRIGWRKGLRILMELSRALVHAHARGIYHRDIKPANVLFRHDETAVLTDFGIAQILETTRLTRTGMVFGTPYFMSPARLSGEPASDHSDLYALGASVFVALTDQYPFPGAEVDDIIRAMKLGEAVPAHLLEPTVPKPLSTLMGRLLRRGPKDRIESAAELLRELEQLPKEMADGPEAPDRVGGAYRAQRFVYMTDVGLTYAAKEMTAGTSHLVKYVSPLVSYGSAFEGRLRELREGELCHVVERGVHTLLVTTAPAGRTFTELAGDGRVREGFAIPVALSLALAVARRLKQMGTPHGDLDPTMTMLTTLGTVDLLDAGQASLLEPSAYAAGRRTATKLPYSSPELLLGQLPSRESDAYALGALLYWLMTTNPPIAPGPQVERVERVMQGRIVEEPLKRAGIPVPLADLVRRLMTVKAKQRPSASDAADELAALPGVAVLSPEMLRDLIRNPAKLAAS